MGKITIVPATEKQMPVVRTLFEDYQNYLGVDLCFQGFVGELDGLPGRYAEPDGFVLLAMQGGVACGCVAVRRMDEEQAELKRLFVKPEAQGDGTGRQLFDAAMTRAEAHGYLAILLDTLPQMKTAQAMYLKKGFVKTVPYVHNPLEGVQYFRYEFAH